MKQLVCEMCGGTDLVKDGGVFVCQTCGCKYSVEEAKKMMVEGTVEVTGTVKIDDSDKKQEQVQNYLEMANAAFTSEDIEGTVNYCDKALELDPRNYDAWVIKAKAAGWGSTLKDIKVPQAITAAKRAVDLAPEFKKYEVGEETYTAIKKQIVALLTLANRMPIAASAQYIQKVFMSWLSALEGVPYLKKELIEKEIRDCETTCSNSKSAMSPSARKIYAAYFAVNHNESYDDTFRKRLKDKIELEDKRYKELIEKEKNEKAERKKAYWESHIDEKNALENEKTALQEQIKILEKQIANYEADASIKELESSIVSITKERDGLGLFKGKEKKALQERIDEMNGQLKEAKTKVEQLCSPIRTSLSEVRKRVAEIDGEFAKER